MAGGLTLPLALLLSCVALSSAVETLSLSYCSFDVCYGQCNPPNEPPGDLVQVHNGSYAGCFCACGREAGEQCNDDRHCVRGNECAAPSDFTNIDDVSMGVCQDKCKNKVCPQYFKCHIEFIEPVCYCDLFHCSESLELEVEANRQVAGMVQSTRFKNSCAMTNENCELYTANMMTDLWYSTSIPGEAYESGK